MKFHGSLDRVLSTIAAGYNAGCSKILIPFTTRSHRYLKALNSVGFITTFTVVRHKVKSNVLFYAQVFLSFPLGEKTISSYRLYLKPSMRVFISHHGLRKLESFNFGGCVLLSTPTGFKTHHECLQSRSGGLVAAAIYG